jgi:hypothetical protein
MSITDKCIYHKIENKYGRKLEIFAIWLVESWTHYFTPQKIQQKNALVELITFFLGLVKMLSYKDLWKGIQVFTNQNLYRFRFIDCCEEWKI